MPPQAALRHGARHGAPHHTALLKTTATEQQPQDCVGRRTAAPIPAQSPRGGAPTRATQHVGLGITASLSPSQRTARDTEGVSSQNECVINQVVVFTAYSALWYRRGSPGEAMWTGCTPHSREMLCMPRGDRRWGPAFSRNAAPNPGGPRQV